MPKLRTQPEVPLHLGLVLFPGCMPSGLFAVTDVVRALNLRTGRECFRTSWVGINRSSIATFRGPSLSPSTSIAEADCDAWLVPGMWVTSDAELERALAAQRALIDILRALPRAAELWSYCAGVPLLAAAGRLNGKSATATWWMQDTLAKRFPRVRWCFDEQLVEDGRAWTAAGPNGYLPIMLERARARIDDASLQDVQQLLMLPRPRGQHACFRQVELMTLRDPELRSVLVFAQRPAATELTLRAAAAHQGVSIRTLCRRVASTTGLAAGEWLRRIKARQVSEALTRTEQPLKQISGALGYSSDASMSRAFRSVTGNSPAQFRRIHTEAAGRSAERTP